MSPFAEQETEIELLVASSVVIIVPGSASLLTSNAGTENSIFAGFPPFPEMLQPAKTSGMATQARNIIVSNVFT